MKAIGMLASFGMTACCAMSAHSQGTFQNLDFEAARIVPVQGSPFYPYGIASTNALPGWTVYYGTSQQADITYNDPAIGSTWVTLCATNGVNIEGSFSVLLQGGVSATDASIRQTGLVPLDAQSLYFEARAGAGALVVSLGGQSIPLFVIAPGPNYTWYGADVSAFAGQTLALEFSASRYLLGPNNWNLDSIGFSPLSIPEPSAFGLFALGALLLGWQFVRKS